MFAQLAVAVRLDRPDRNEWIWAHRVERMALMVTVHGSARAPRPVNGYAPMCPAS